MPFLSPACPRTGVERGIYAAAPSSVVPTAGGQAHEEPELRQEFHSQILRTSG